MGGRGGASHFMNAVSRMLGPRGPLLSAMQALPLANPNYHLDRVYRINCQRCVWAFEMLRRGYSVEAASSDSSDYVGSIRSIHDFWSSARNADQKYWLRVDRMASMFSNCYRMKKLPAAMQSLDLSKCTTLSSLFYETLSLEDIDLSSWRNVKPTSIGSLFASCSNLRRINLAGWDTSALTGSHSSMFSGAVYESLDQTGWSVSNTGLVPDCPILEDWYPPVFNVACNISKLYSLSDVSLERLVQALPRRTTAATITMGAPLIKRLSTEQIATITGKGWTIA